MKPATQPAYQLIFGYPENQRSRAAQLFWQAFSGKLGKVLAPEEKALRLVEKLLNPDFAVSAVSPNGELLGMAGFKTREGALLDGGFSEIMQVYGLFGGLWRGLALHILDRSPEEGQLLMDGIFVSSEARGQGIGSALLNAVCTTAIERNCSKVRLDVIDSNPRARALYERQGFEETTIEHTGPLKHVFGFSSASRMEKQVQPA